VESWEKVVKIRRFGVKKSHQNFVEMKRKYFWGVWVKEVRKEIFRVEMCSHEFFLKHALMLYSLPYCLYHASMRRKPKRDWQSVDKEHTYLLTYLLIASVEL